MSNHAPDAIVLAQKKILRALEKSNAIHQKITEYATDGDAYEIVTHPDGKKTTGVLKQPPPEIAILVGELVYHLRSTLDQLFFELVKRNHRGGSIPRLNDIQFPICEKPPSGFTPPVPRDKFQSAARDCLSDKAFAFIEGLQPYYGSKQPNDMLGLINTLSRIDKHRYVNVTTLRFDLEQTVITPEGFTSLSSIINVDSGAKLEGFVHDDAVLKRAVQVDTEVIPRIAFNEPEISNWGPEPYLFDSVVDDAPTMMFGYIIPAFHHFYLNP